MLSAILNRPNCLLNRRNRYQFLATLVVNIITFSHGFGIGWLSPTLRKLESDNSPLNFQVNIMEISWIGSMLGIGSITGNILIGTLLERIGRKTCIYIIALPHLCLWILIYFAQTVEYLYVARMLGGICGGGGYIVLPIFVAEIVDTDIRGTLSSIMMLSVNIGILAGFVCSTTVRYHVIPIIAVTLPLIYFILNLFLPETPYYLIRSEKYKAAETSFRFYKNVSKSSEGKDLIEFENLKIALSKGGSNENEFKDFVSKPALKAYCSAIVLLCANQISGLFTFVNYMSDIFAAANCSVEPNTCTIIVGVVQILGVYTTTLVCDKYGRKILMLISSGGVAVSLTAFGLFTYFSKYYDLTALGWLPLLLMSMDIFLGNIGLVGLFFVVVIEVYPAKIRSVAASCSIVGVSILVFFMLKIFPICMDQLGISVTMWGCAAITFFSFVYFAFFLQETKGKNIVEN